ncbi:hypothetical protein BBJ29_003977 [Phytophthora kernoviae]|uniref:Nucleoplasmin-like domain-containing protein n=1 Tax=Phytophthora kernoviae TaxID=325452 RepID=A0A3F2RN82_9STRA|nr:hypothetical protein BBJ29_003977 [Phytophthora kernoviae]RLN60981.1 hypothetical protein BBP00_00005681 [Phytophthora kernoviae]
METFAEDTGSRRHLQEERKHTHELVLRTWRQSFRKEKPETDAEKALYRRLVSLVDEHEDQGDEGLTSLLLHDIGAKATYVDSSWGYVDAANIGKRFKVKDHFMDAHCSLMLLVSSVDDCIIALQEQPKKQFLDPLSWDLPPHKAVVAIVEAVLLLFDVPVPAKGNDEDIWRACWGLWIVKNIDAHSGGWEWMSNNEPTGLFTKPYALSAVNLDRVCELLEKAANLAPPEFDGFAAVQKLVTPPQRTTKDNIWFRCETEDGIDYFYNRLYQSVTLDRPDDFDGAHIPPKKIPIIVQELIAEILQSDVTLRLELERRSKQRIHTQLLEQDQWVECLDGHTMTKYYYSVKHYQMSPNPPDHGVFESYRDSVAYNAVLRLQAAYRRRRLLQKTQTRKAKRVTETKAAVVAIPEGFVLNVVNATCSASNSDDAQLALALETQQVDGNAWKGAVAHLGHKQPLQVKLDLVFGHKVKFYLSKGVGAVNLTGYFQPGPPAELFEEDTTSIEASTKKSKKRAREEKTGKSWDQVSSSDSEEALAKEVKPAKASKPEAASVKKEEQKKPKQVEAASSTPVNGNATQGKKKRKKNKKANKAASN